MSKRVEFRWPEGLLERVDAVRGDVPRASWVRSAVERALGEREPSGAFHAALSKEMARTRVEKARDDARVIPAPAEQPVMRWDSIEAHEEAARAFQGLSRSEAFRRATQK